MSTGRAAAELHAAEVAARAAELRTRADAAAALVRDEAPLRVADAAADRTAQQELAAAETRARENRKANVAGAAEVERKAADAEAYAAQAASAAAALP